MTKSETIPIIKQAIAFRDEATAIEARAKKLSKNSMTVYIDFNAVKFISRSFADELINSIERLKKSGISLKVKNTSPGIKRMLDIVKFTRKNILRKVGTFRITSS